MYADKVSEAMKEAIEETERRRKIQMEYNEKHRIVPQSVKKEITDIIERKHEKVTVKSKKDIKKADEFEEVFSFIDQAKAKYKDDIQTLIKVLTDYMFELADRLEFEKAMVVREETKKLVEDK
jgi:excinuclease ABC subunit B